MAIQVQSMGVARTARGTGTIPWGKAGIQASSALRMKRTRSRASPRTRRSPNPCDGELSKYFHLTTAARQVDQPALTRNRRAKPLPIP